MTISSDGGSEMFRSLYEKHYRRMIRFYVHAFRLSEEDAEDLAQEAFLRFFEAMEEYRGEAEWAYFETIARRVLYNKFRSAGAAKRSGHAMSMDDLPRSSEPATTQPDIAEREAAKLAWKRFRQALDELPKGQRQCVQMRMEGFSYKEIAGFLRITVDAVKTRLREARKFLRVRLEDLGGSIVWLDLPEDES